MCKEDIEKEIYDYILKLCEKESPKIRKIVQEINKIDNSLDRLDYYDMNCFNSFVETFLTNDTPAVLASRVADGYFKTFHDVFRFDEYENFESCYLCEMFYEYVDSADDIANRIIDRFEIYDINDSRLSELVKQLRKVE